MSLQRYTEKTLIIVWLEHLSAYPTGHCSDFWNNFMKSVKSDSLQRYTEKTLTTVWLEHLSAYPTGHCSDFWNNIMKSVKSDSLQRYTEKKKIYRCWLRYWWTYLSGSHTVCWYRLLISVFLPRSEKRILQLFDREAKKVAYMQGHCLSMCSM